MCYTISFINYVMDNMPHSVSTENEFMAKRFVQQVDHAESAVVMGKVLMVINTRESGELCSPMRVYTSQIDPTIQVLADDITMGIYEDRIALIIAKRLPDFNKFVLFLRALRISYFPDIPFIEESIYLLMEAITKNGIDLVKLSTNIPFHIKGY